MHLTPGKHQRVGSLLGGGRQGAEYRAALRAQGAPDQIVDAVRVGDHRGEGDRLTLGDRGDVGGKRQNLWSADVVDSTLTRPGALAGQARPP